MQRVEFLVEGSQGDRYALIFEVNGTHAKAFCTCQAGANGQYCKHRTGVMDGEVSALLSGNTADVARLRVLLSGTDLEAAYRRLLEAEATCSAAKKELDIAKKVPCQGHVSMNRTEYFDIAFKDGRVDG